MKRKILISGIYYEGGGLGNVMNYLANHLLFDFDTTCIAFLPMIQGAPQQLERAGQQVYNIAYQRNSFKISEKDEVYHRIRNNEYEAIILLGPVQLNTRFINQLKELNDRMLLIAFLPYEGKVTNSLDVPVLNKIDFGVFYSKFTYDCFDDLNKSSGAIHNFRERFGYIMHGVDQQKFYPISVNRKVKTWMARSVIEEHQDLPEDAFIILNSNKPFYRKGIDSTLSAFERFSTHHKNCFLHLHFGSISKSWHKYMMRKIASFSFNDQVIVTHTNYPDQAHSDEWMNCLYNACDVGISSSCGEGWGLGIFEHAATCAPVIVPNHTVFKENWEHIAILTETDDIKYLAAENTDVYLSSVDSIYDAFMSLYHSKELYEAYAEQCFKHATSAKYSWENTSAYFREILLNKQVHQPFYGVS